jgi:hypothetical protein
MPAKHVVFTHFEHPRDPAPPGDHRATPGNVVVDLGAGDPPLVKFTNLTRHDITVELLDELSKHVPDRVQFRIAPGASYTLLLRGLKPGQYYYSATVGADLGMVKGNSGPGIIVTP